MREDTPARGQGTGDGERVEDSELLRRYADEKSEAAFAELVRRRIDLVYSVARRQVGGDAQLAEDVTQKVFADLARKAAALAGRAVLSGWLYRSAHYAATDVVRTERRRRAREQENQIMTEISAESDGGAEWERLRPMLDQAMGELSEADRDAVALRFFEGRAFAEIGRTLRLTEDTARKRVDRALDKLHGLLARRGVNSTTAALGLVLANQAGVAAPVGLAGTVTSASVAAGAAAGGGWIALFMSMTKLQVGIAGALAAAGATAYVSQGQTNTGLQQKITALQAQKTTIAALRTENRQLANAVAEAEVLRQEVGRAQQAQRLRNEQAKIVNAQNRGMGAQEEIERINGEGRKLVDEYKALNEKVKDPSLTAGAKTELQLAMQEKAEAVKAKQQEGTAFIENARANGWLPAVSTTEKLQLRRSAVDGPKLGTDKISSLHLPHASQWDAFSVYELLSGLKIVRDSSLVAVRGSLDLDATSLTRMEALESLRNAMREQLNIVLEPESDGKVVAKFAAPR